MLNFLAWIFIRYLASGSDSSPLGWQTSFCWPSRSGQFEPGLGKALAPLDLGILVVFLLPCRVSMKCLHCWKAQNPWVWCHLCRLQPPLVPLSFVFCSVSGQLGEGVFAVTPVCRYEQEVGTRIWSYCMEGSWDTNQAVVSKYSKCLLLYSHIGWITCAWINHIQLQLFGRGWLWLKVIGPTHQRLTLGRSRTSNLCF